MKEKITKKPTWVCFIFNTLSAICLVWLLFSSTLPDILAAGFSAIVFRLYGK